MYIVKHPRLIVGITEKRFLITLGANKMTLFDNPKFEWRFSWITGFSIITFYMSSHNFNARNAGFNWWMWTLYWLCIKYVTILFGWLDDIEDFIKKLRRVADVGWARNQVSTIFIFNSFPNSLFLSTAICNINYLWLSSASTKRSIALDTPWLWLH